MQWKHPRRRGKRRHRPPKELPGTQATRMRRQQNETEYRRATAEKEEDNP